MRFPRAQNRFVRGGNLVQNSLGYRKDHAVPPNAQGFTASIAAWGNNGELIAKAVQQGKGLPGKHALVSGMTRPTRTLPTSILSCAGDGGTDQQQAEDTKADEECPRLSLVTARLAAQQGRNHQIILPTVKNSTTARERETFVVSLPTRVQVKLDQQFGKEIKSRSQCFKSQANLRHILIPLYKSRFLLRMTDWETFAAAFHLVKIFLELWDEHRDIDPSGVQGFQQDWESSMDISTDRVRMATAALLHFDGDIADTTRWIGGPHVGAHRDIPRTIQYLRGKIDNDTLDILEKSWKHGVPKQCNAYALEENFRAYLAYGNHATVTKEPDIARKTLIKDSKKGYVLLFDKRMVYFALNCHVTPIGLVGLDNKYKTPRPIFDSTFRPQPNFSGINDWTTKETEPPLHFGPSFGKYLVWLYNLRITYPTQEIFLGDDDISGAFRHQKYHPNLVGMHSCIMAGHLACSTGMTFGDNTSPSNFEPIADARRQLARYLWMQGDTISKTKKYLPAIQLAETPTRTEIDGFTRADRDSLNKGVMNESGKRLPPQFDHHVDDNIYADVGEHMMQTLCSSVLALYHILGFPKDTVPDALSRDKLCCVYTHTRKTLGHWIDSRAMTIGLVPEKRTMLKDILDDWISNRQSFTLREISSLHGSLESVTRYTTWARPLFFGTQNAIRHALIQRYHILNRTYKPDQRKEVLKKKLTASLEHRLGSLIAKEKAHLLWNSRKTIQMTNEIRASLVKIRNNLADDEKQWIRQIGFIIKRDPHIITLGDASGHGGGGYCETLRFWFDIVWSERIRKSFEQKRRRGKNKTVHINSLEFIIVVLQYAATAVRLQSLPHHDLMSIFPNGIPEQPVLMCRTDNTAAEAWSNHVTSRSPQGQRLIGVLAELLRTNNLGLNAKHIAGVENVLADFISRPTHFHLSHSHRAEQIFQTHESMRTWDYFLPSQEFLQNLYSLLFNEQTRDPLSLPKNLGHFVPAGSTILCSPTI